MTAPTAGADHEALISVWNRYQRLVRECDAAYDVVERVHDTLPVPAETDLRELWHGIRDTDSISRPVYHINDINQAATAAINRMVGRQDFAGIPRLLKNRARLVNELSKQRKAWKAALKACRYKELDDKATALLDKVTACLLEIGEAHPLHA